MSEPRSLSRKRLKLKRVVEYGWCWEHQGQTLSTDAAAELVADELISAREREGKRSLG